MWNPFVLQVGLEVGLSLLFFGIMLSLWRKVDASDGALWVMVWCTRVFAAVNGAMHLPGQAEVAGVYIGLQACSALALMIILTRSELRVIRQRFMRALAFQLSGEPSRSFGVDA